LHSPCAQVKQLQTEVKEVVSLVQKQNQENYKALENLIRAESNSRVCIVFKPNQTIFTF
jgi:hypothetical protein